MSFADAIIPLVLGVLLVARPQLFLKRRREPAEQARKRVLLRRIGYVLIGVAALYVVIAVFEPGS